SNGDGGVPRRKRAAGASAERMGGQVQRDRHARTMTAFKSGILALAALIAVPAQAAQPGTPEATVIAIPPLTTPDSGTKGNEMLAEAWQVTKLIETDL